MEHNFDTCSFQDIEPGWEEYMRVAWGNGSNEQYEVEGGLEVVYEDPIVKPYRAPYLSPPRGMRVTSTYEISVSELENRLMDPSGVAKRCRFRFVDCKRLLSGAVTIHETDVLPENQYAAISYPWVGNACDDIPALGATFNVFQRKFKAGDAISLEMLRIACDVALQRGLKLLWFDRLCVLQDDSCDKDWQIDHMCQVYESCRLCIVAPGGLQRLVYLSETTNWIMRMWTLQEALVPSEAQVLVSAGEDFGDLKYARSNRLRPVYKCRDPPAFTCSLSDMLRGVSSKKFSIFGPVGRLHARHMQTAMEFRENLDGDKATLFRHHGIWCSAMLRQSTRPLDALLSVMYLLQIPPPPSDKRTPETVVKVVKDEFLRYGSADVRLQAFKLAFQRYCDHLSPVWRTHIKLLREIIELFPYLPGGLPRHLESGDFDWQAAGDPVTRDEHGCRVYLGSAVCPLPKGGYSLQPCQIIRPKNRSATVCIVTCGGAEFEHDGACELFPFDCSRMEWVETSSSDGAPPGRKPIGTGHDGEWHDYVQLHHGMYIKPNGLCAIGKVYPEEGCYIAKKGKEITVHDYMVLCWRDDCGWDECDANCPANQQDITKIFKLMSMLNEQYAIPGMAYIEPVYACISDITGLNGADSIRKAMSYCGIDPGLAVSLYGMVDPDRKTDSYRSGGSYDNQDSYEQRDSYRQRSSHSKQDPYDKQDSYGRRGSYGHRRQDLYKKQDSYGKRGSYGKREPYEEADSDLDAGPHGNIDSDHDANSQGDADSDPDVDPRSVDDSHRRADSYRRGDSYSGADSYRKRDSYSRRRASLKSDTYRSSGSYGSGASYREGDSYCDSDSYDRTDSYGRGDSYSKRDSHSGGGASRRNDSNAREDSYSRGDSYGKDDSYRGAGSTGQYGSLPDDLAQMSLSPRQRNREPTRLLEAQAQRSSSQSSNMSSRSRRA